MNTEQPTYQELLQKLSALESENESLKYQQKLLKENNDLVLWGTGSAFWEWDYITGIVKFSDRKAEMLGYKSEELNPDIYAFTSMIHPDDYEATMNNIRNHLVGKTEFFCVEYRIKTKNGEWKWFYDKGRIIERDENNKPLKIFGIVNDITDKKNTLLILKENEERFKNIFNYINDGIRIVDYNGVIIAENSKMSEITGIPIENVKGKFVWDLVYQLSPYKDQTPDNYNRIKNVSLASLKSGRFPFPDQRVEKVLQCADGSIKIVEVNYFSVPKENGFLFYTVMRDITYIKKTQMELYSAQGKTKESENRFQVFMANIPAYVYIKDDSLDYIYSNKMVDESFGIKDKRNTKSAKEIFEPETAKMLEAADKRILNGEVERIDLTYTCKINKKITWLHDHKFALILPEGSRAVGGIAIDITELKDTELHSLNLKVEIEKSEEKYRLIAENTSDGILVFGADTNIIYASPSYLKQLGYGQNQALVGNSETIYGLIHPYDRDAIFNKIFKAMTEKKSELVYTYRAKHQAGYYVWREDNAKFKYDKDGNIINTYVISRDITERKQKELEIKKLQKAIESSKTSIVITDYEGNIEYANPFFAEVTGYSPSEYIGKNPKILTTKYHATDYYKNFWDTIKSGETWEGEFYNKKKNGENYWEKAIISPIKNDKDEITNFVAVKTDITERKEIEKEVIIAKEKAEDSEYKVRSMFENTLTGFLFFTPEGNILEANPAVLKMFASPSLDLTKQINVLTFESLRKSGFSKNVEICIEEKKVISDETLYTSKWGKTIYVKYFLIPVFQQNKLTGIWANLQDLTDLWKTQNDLMLAKEKAEESDKLKTAFLNNISHEIRTPLNAISGFSEMITLPNQSIEKLERYSEIIQLSSKKLIDIVTDVIEVSQLQSMQSVNRTEQFDLRKLFNEIISEYYFQLKSNKIEFVIKINPDYKVFNVLSDKNKFYKILKHLIDNSVKFTSKGAVTIDFQFFNDKVEFTVSDTGIGITKDMQKIIFEPFRQVEIGNVRNYGGNGIGLAIAKGYVQLLNGSISLNSEFDIGTSVFVSIPVQSETNVIANEDDIPLSTKNIDTILIVEDEYSNYIYLEEIVKVLCSNILYAANGRDAIDICRNHENIDIILMDLKMPIMDGFTATKLIKAFSPETVIIAQTSYASESDKENIIEIGFNDYVCKPIKRQHLIELIHKHFE